jgi:hypothetical protein
MAARRKKKAATKALTKTRPNMIQLPDELSGELDKYINRDKASATGGGGMPFIRTRGGNFTFNEEVLDQPLPVIVIGAVRENLYYPEAYDPDAPGQSPTCFALDTEQNEAAMAPPPDLESKESDSCVDCWANAFGTADRGKGKACKNNVRLVVLPAIRDEDGELPDLSKVAGARIAVPPTSLKNWSSYANKIIEGLHAPLFAVITDIETEPAEKGGFSMFFDLQDGVPTDQIMTVKERVDSDGITNIQTLPMIGSGDDNKAERKPSGRAKVRKKVVKKKAAARKSRSRG